MTYIKLTPVRTLTVDSLTVHIYPSAEMVALAASHQAAEILRLAVANRGEAAAVFATGRSQKQCLQYLTDPEKTPVDWQNITGFHLDEYLGVAAEHPASFRQYLRQHLTDRVRLKHFYEIEGDGLLPVEICEQYERQLRSPFGRAMRSPFGREMPSQPLDLCFLGIGNNGHLAFNDPAVANFTDERWVKLVRLDDANRQQQASSTAFATIDAVPHYAVTLTLSAIRSIQHNLCLAFGSGKAAVVRSLVTGPISPSCPASILRQIPQAVLMIDTAAASLLPGE